MAPDQGPIMMHLQESVACQNQYNALRPPFCASSALISVSKIVKMCFLNCWILIDTHYRCSSHQQGNASRGDRFDWASRSLQAVCVLMSGA